MKKNSHNSRLGRAVKRPKSRNHNTYKSFICLVIILLMCGSSKSAEIIVNYAVQSDGEEIRNPYYFPSIFADRIFYYGATT